MKLNSTGRHEEVLRTGRSLRWAAVLVVATVGTGLRTAHAGINQWTSLGPYGGAIKTLVIDPQNTSTLYAWSAGSELFKSTDGAASWNAMRLPLPFAVWAVALAPGGVIYVGGETYIENQIYGSPPYPYGAY
jgi:disulfide bond formation protein DsbB